MKNNNIFFITFSFLIAVEMNVMILGIESQL